jgi:ring-1,2-phenylacetyl-CoA epoxidase subunit PaaC
MESPLNLNPELKTALRDYLLAMADDELILGHRNSEWCGCAPILEEDIAFANIALDEIGHAAIWYALVAQLAGENPDTYPDHLIFFREAQDYRNSRIVELPKGDWAFSMLRQYLFDAAEKTWLNSLKHSAYAPIAEAAAKISIEEIYHLRHTSAWIQRLGLGTAESHHRLQFALEALWPFSRQLFIHIPQETHLVQAGYIPAAEAMRTEWEALVCPFLLACDLVLPDVEPVATEREQHTEHLKVLITEMQSVARMDALADW